MEDYQFNSYSRNVLPPLDILKKENLTRKAISIVIPAYNEENRVGDTLRELLPRLNDQDEVVVVFDGTDNTPSVVRSFGKKVDLVTSNKRLGKGGAILLGLQFCHNDIIGFIDADNAVPINDVFRLASNVSAERPCVIGSRWVRSSIILKNEPFFNVLAGRIFHYIVYFMLGITVKDTQCGAKFFLKEVIKEILPKITITSRMIDVALLYHLKLIGKQIFEVGVTWKHNDDTKLPILKAIPFMFATIMGLKMIHSKRLGDRSNLIRKFSDSFEHN